MLEPRQGMVVVLGRMTRTNDDRMSSRVDDCNGEWAWVEVRHGRIVTQGRMKMLAVRKILGLDAARGLYTTIPPKDPWNGNSSWAGALGILLQMVKRGLR